MRCEMCNAPLHYHSSGLTCRNCGFIVDHELLGEEKCVSCNHLLEESEKTTGICTFCQYDIVKTSK